MIGVLPRFLQKKEIAHPGLTDLIFCETMHQRKTKMYEISQGFLGLPGGFGTLEEISEILTWQQLGMHEHPVGFLNIGGFYDHLEKLFETMKTCELLKPENRDMALFDDSFDSLFERMKVYKAPKVSKWLDKARS